MRELVKVFENSELGNVRIVIQNGEPWFVAKAVAAALDYAVESLEKIGRLIAHVPSIWTARKRLPVRSDSGVEQAREVWMLSEQGLYFFLGRSDKAKAHPYQMWIAGDVMPDIRKTGAYTVSDRSQLIETPTDATAKVLREAGLTPNQVAIGMSNTYRRITGIDVLELSGIGLPPPVQKRVLTPTEIGQELGEDISPSQINKLLIDMGYQTCRVNGGYVPTELGKPHALLLDTAKRRSDGTPVKQLKWYASIIPIIREWLVYKIGAARVAPVRRPERKAYVRKRV